MSFIELAKNRYSVRSYKDVPVESEKLDKIIEAGSFAPTARNFQPQKIYLATSKESREKISSVCRFTFGAPVIAVIAYDRDRAWKNKLMPPYESGETDAAIVATHIMLAATEQGLGTCWVGYFNTEDMRAALGLPENVVVTALLTIGYAADDAQPLPLHFERREREDMIIEI